MNEGDRVGLFLILVILAIMICVVGYFMPGEAPTKFLCVDSTTKAGDPYFLCQATDEVD